MQAGRWAASSLVGRKQGVNFITLTTLPTTPLTSRMIAIIFEALKDIHVVVGCCSCTLHLPHATEDGLDRVRKVQSGTVLVLPQSATASISNPGYKNAV